MDKTRHLGVMAQGFGEVGKNIKALPKLSPVIQ